VEADRPEAEEAASVLPLERRTLILDWQPTAGPGLTALWVITDRPLAPTTTVDVS
jgi:hypothetical protein